MITREEVELLADQLEIVARPGGLGSAGAAALLDLAQQVEDLQADAARYREIRSSYTARKALCGQCTEEECDALIDEAMK